MTELEIWEYFAEIEAIQSFDQLQPMYLATKLAWSATIAWLGLNGFEPKQAQHMIGKAVRKFRNAE